MQYKGYLLYDPIDVNKNQWFINHTIENAAQKGISLELKLIDDSLDYNIDLIINRSRNHLLASYAENHNIRVFNSSFVTKTANDKDLTYQEMANHNIPFLPYITIDIDALKKSDYTKILSKANSFGYPFVSKPAEGHGGNHVCLINNENDFIKELDDLCEDSINRERYGKLLLQKCSNIRGKDLRVYLINGSIVCGILRQGENDFRANFSLGGKSNVHTLSKEEKDLVEKITSFYSSDFIGIDFIYNDNKPIFNEIEDAVGCRMVYANTNIDIVDLYLNHIKSILEK